MQLKILQKIITIFIIRMVIKIIFYIALYVFWVADHESAIKFIKLICLNNFYK